MKKALIYSLIIVATCAFILRLIMNYASADYENYTEDPTNSEGFVANKNTGSFYTVTTPEEVGRVCFDAYAYCWGGGDKDCDPGYTVRAFIIDTNSNGTAETSTSTSDTIWNLEDFTPIPWNATYWATSSMSMCFDFETPVTVTDYAKIGLYQNTYHADNNVRFNYTDTYDATNRLLTYAGGPSLSIEHSPLMLLDSVPGIYDEVSVVEMPAWDGTVYIGHEGLSIPQYIDCMLDQTDCQIWLNYGYDHIGYIAYFIPYSTTRQNIPSYAVASSTLELKLILKEYYTMPVQTAATNTKWCVYVQDPADETNDEQLCYTDVYWTDGDLLGLPEYNIASACDDVAASDSSFGDDFRYGLECAFRKLTYWTFTPQPASVVKFRTAYEDSKDKFPFSVYNDFSQSFDTMKDTPDHNLSVPFGLWQDKNMSEAEPIAYMTLSTTTLLTRVDEDLFDDYYLYAQIFIYMFGFTYILWRIFHLSQKANDS